MTNHIQEEKARDYYGEFINHAKHCAQCSPSLGMFCLEGQRLRGHKVTERDWRDEFREYFDKTLKPKKPTMGGLDRELCINFIENLLSHHLEAEREKSYRTGLEDGTLKLGETARKNYQMGYNEASQAMRGKIEKLIVNTPDEVARLNNEAGVGEPIAGNAYCEAIGYEKAIKETLSLLDKQTK